MPSLHGKFVWYELMTSEPEAAEAFYQRVVGWGAQRADMPGGAYTMLTAADVPVAGLMGLPEEAKAAGAGPAWIGYVAVDDVDSSAAKAAEAGGSVRRAPDDIPGVGRFAIIADPQGAMLALFQGAGSGGQPPAPGAPGTGGWHELLARDEATIFPFYAAVFG